MSDVDAPVDGPAIAKPVDTRRGRAAVDTSAPATYAAAQKFAASKGQHDRRPGSLELPESTYSWRDGYTGEKCQGQLRSVYARITTPSTSYGKPGKTTWTPVGVWCDGCAAVWPKPLDPAEATRRRSRW